MSGQIRADLESTSPVNRIVLLGASNLTLSLNLITRLIQQKFGHPSDVLVAAGHGRSYGHYSQVLIRSLPGITSCNLWPHLESTNKMPTFAFLTDIGNDIPFGYEPGQLLEWIDFCIEKLQRQDARIVVTNLPMELIETLSERHFKVVRTLFFPFSRLTREELLERAHVVHQGLEEMASKMKFKLYEPNPCWFGPDIIHVLYWKRKEFYGGIIDPIPDSVDVCKQFGNRPIRLSAWKQRPRFACKKLLGWERRHPQPSGLLTDGTTISMY